MTPWPAGRRLSSAGRLVIGLLFLMPFYFGFALLRLAPGSFTVETVGFLSYRVLPATVLVLSLVLALGWLAWRRPPHATTMTFAGIVAVHALTGLVFFPQTYSILAVPMAIWSGILFLVAGRLDWVDVPPLLRHTTTGPIAIHPERTPATPPSEKPPVTPVTDGPPRPETDEIQQRFQRLREELRPRPKERIYPRPSPIFLLILAVIAGALSTVLLMPSAPSTVPLYGEQSEGFEAEPLWDPLLLRPQQAPRATPAEGEAPRLWLPRPRQPDLPEAWEEEMKSGPVRAVFSKRSEFIRIETPGCAANVNPLMEFPEVSADGFALLPWNLGNLTPGPATGWQQWVAGRWTAWVRYSGDPYISGAWPPRTRRGAGPWLGKVALQLDPESHVVSLSAVNRLNLALSARQADLCSLSVEPIRDARVRWGTPETIIDELGEKSEAWLHRTATAFVRRGHRPTPKGHAEPLPSFTSPRFEGWLIVRQRDYGPGFLIYAPFWQRQIGIERTTHTPLGDPSNRLEVTLEGLTAHVRFSLLAPEDPLGSTVATVAPGTYLNVLLLIPLQEGQTDETAVNTLRRIITDHAPPLLLLEARDLIYTP